MRHISTYIAAEAAPIEIPSTAFLFPAIQFVSVVIFKVILFVLVLYVVYAQLLTFHAGLPIPIHIERQLSLDERQTLAIRKTFRILWGREASVGIVEGVKLGAKSIRTASVDPVLIAVLLHTESEGKLNAVSSKGYKGVLQTPSMTKIAEVDIMHGCKILDEKLAWKSVNPQRNIRVALALYKGGLSREAFSQADEVLRKYRVIKTRVLS